MWKREKLQGSNYSYFWTTFGKKKKKALCFNKPFFALFSCFCHCHLKLFFIQEARAQ